MWETRQAIMCFQNGRVNSLKSFENPSVNPCKQAHSAAAYHSPYCHIDLIGRKPYSNAFLIRGRRIDFTKQYTISNNKYE